MIYVSISEYVVLILEIEVQVWKNTTENLISKKNTPKNQITPPPKKNSLQGFYIKDYYLWSMNLKKLLRYNRFPIFQCQLFERYVYMSS